MKAQFRIPPTPKSGHSMLRSLYFPVPDRHRLGEYIDIPHDKIYDPLVSRIGKVRADF